MSSTPISLTADPEPPLDRLARELALNYLDTSLKSEELLGSGRNDRIRETFADESIADTAPGPSRNILVLGAGASLGAFGPVAFPAARKAMDDIDRLLGPRPRAISKRINDEKRRLQIAYDYAGASEDFETHLAILSSIYSPGTIANHLSTMYAERYWPHLTFELIAHMLKHRFVDAVINFNFDELLDQAIQEELGRTEYHHIISDGDCQTMKDIMVGGRLKVPIHIKPHGTARHRSTLRFTKEHYFTLPDNMRDFLQLLVAGYTQDDESGQRYRTNIISVGFGMGSIELLEMLRYSMQKVNGKRAPGIHLFHINQPDFRPTMARLAGKTGIRGQGLIEVDAAAGLHDTIRRLVGKIGDHFKDAYKPRGTARHEFVHQLFVDESARTRVPAGKVDGRENLDYYRARLCAELVLSLAKGRGRVDLSTLVDDRVGIYFDAMRRQAEDTGAPGGESTVSLEGILALFKSRRLVRGGMDQNILTAQCYGNEPESDLGRWLWESLRLALDNIGNDTLSQHAEKMRKSGPGSPPALLQALVDSDARDINADFRHRHLLLSAEPVRDEILHTNLSYTLKFAEMLRETWDVLLAVSEYARVLDRIERVPGTNLRGRRICLILAETEQTDTSEERVQGFRDRHPETTLEVYQIPFWMHNHHMVITFQRKTGRDGKHTPDYLRAIHYDRRGLSNRINPVSFGKDDAEDLKRLGESFFSYATSALLLKDRDQVTAYVRKRSTWNQERSAREVKGGNPSVPQDALVDAVKAGLLGEWLNGRAAP